MLHVWLLYIKLIFNFSLLIDYHSFENEKQKIGCQSCLIILTAPQFPIVIN